MNKIFSILFLSLTISLFAVRTAPVYAAEPPTIIEGTIGLLSYHQFNSNLADWAGALPSVGQSIQIICGSAWQTVITDQNGFFHAEFPKNQCDVGTQIIYFDHHYEGTPTPDFGGLTSNGIVNEQRHVVFHAEYYALLNYVPGAISVPEFGSITAGIAFLGSVGIYLGMRKRNVLKT